MDHNASYSCKAFAADISTVLPAMTPPNVPMFFAQVDTPLFTHLRLTHFDGAVFNLSTFQSLVNQDWFLGELVCWLFHLSSQQAMPQFHIGCKTRASVSWDICTSTLLSFSFLFSPPFPMFHHIQTAAYICIPRDTHISYSHLFLFTIPYLYSLARWRLPIPQFWYSLSLVNMWASSLYPILFPFSNIILFHWWIVLSMSLSRFPLGSTGHRSIHPWHSALLRLSLTIGSAACGVWGTNLQAIQRENGQKFGLTEFRNLLWPKPY